MCPISRSATEKTWILYILSKLRSHDTVVSQPYPLPFVKIIYQNTSPLKFYLLNTAYFQKCVLEKAYFCSQKNNFTIKFTNFTCSRLKKIQVPRSKEQKKERKQQENWEKCCLLQAAMPVKESLLIKCFGTSLCQRKWFDRDTEILLKSIEKWNISFCLLYQLRFCQCTIIWRKKTSLLVLYKERMKTLKKNK